MSHEGFLIAQSFAASLDAEDYAMASQYLAEDCVYHIGETVLVGRNAILDSYRTNGESAKKRFTSVKYTSHVEMPEPNHAVVLFTDRLYLGKQSHEFRCQQHVEIGSDGLIKMIRHEEIPGERQKLKEFEAGLGQKQ